MKKCTDCNEILSLNNFSKNLSNRDGIYGQCKSCRRIKRKRREKNHIVCVSSKTCKRCNSHKHSSEFVPNKSNKDGLNGWCKVCAKDDGLNKKYGISYNQYIQILKTQNNKCAICLTSEPLGISNSFVVDHCHSTGKIRGLLCNHCNTGLGKLGDTIETLERVLSYLKGVLK